MKITSGDYEIYNSGTVLSFEAEPITFHLAIDLKIHLSFKDEEENKDVHKMEFKQISGTELEIILINFNNSLGTGNASPLEVGTLNNKKLYLNFTVYALNIKTTKTVHYTWYLGEGVKIG
ncbi:DUF6864 domain-containing function [Pedobacter sp. Leaf176]|uniref:DUF6864 domain-containing function n=1 Tax=Pedobacter sp. Leaf176 TaxID=1736286 RepID=UPI0006FC2754|nr:hypothetical protein [Pedobacter sp. Leaf176]KQR71879.1 hypothetical protein ASF92_00780 [Pedobacter sp. Leaf176]